MPSIADNANALQSMKDSGQLQPVTAATNNNPPPIAPAGPPSPNPLLRSPLPPSMSYQPDMLRQYFNNAIPQQRVPPLPALANVQANASAKSQASAVASAASTLQILVNGVKSANQARLNLIGSGITVDSNGNVTFNILTDGLTHGRSPWEGDPSVFQLTDDFPFIISLNTSSSIPVSGIGQLGWSLGGTSGSHGAANGGLPPNLGQFFWDNSGTVNQYGFLNLSSSGMLSSNSGANNGWALFDSPGWQASYVFKVDGCPGNITTNVPSFGQKGLYVGLTGTSFWQNSSSNIGPRPDTFFGVRMDTSGYPSAGNGYSVTAIVQSGSNMALTGTFTGANQTTGTTWVGLWFTLPAAGSVSAANAGTFICTAATPTTLTLTNPNGVSQAGPLTGTATGNTPFVATAAANGNGTTVTYTATITNGGTNNYVGQKFYVSGFGNAGNNGGPWTCTANSTTTITLANPLVTGSAETHAGYIAGPFLGDTTLKLEAVQNPSYGTSPKMNFTAGQVLDTGIAPVLGAWHRLDIYCSSSGNITLTLDGSTINTLTATVNKVTVTTGVAGLNGAVAAGQLGITWSVTVDSIPQNVWATGSQVTVTGFSGTQVGFNNGGNPWTVFQASSAAGVYIQYPAATTVSSASVTGTVSGYPAVWPQMVFGNSVTGNPLASNLTFFIDYFSFVWNPALSSAGGTANITKPRYF